jgi:hypothetical protein
LCPSREFRSIEGGARHSRGKRGCTQGEARRCHRVWSKQLQQSFCRPNEPAWIITQIDDQPTIRHTTQDGNNGLDEGLIVIDIKAPDAQITESA